MAQHRPEGVSVAAGDGGQLRHLADAGGHVLGDPQRGHGVDAPGGAEVGQRAKVHACFVHGRTLPDPGRRRLGEKGQPTAAGTWLSSAAERARYWVGVIPVSPRSP